MIVRGSVANKIAERVFLFTYLSSMPSVAPILNDLLTSWYWRRDNDPDSQGARNGRSRSLDVAEKILYVKMGRFGNVTWSCALFAVGGLWLMAVKIGDFGDRWPLEEAAKRPKTVKRMKMNTR